MNAPIHELIPPITASARISSEFRVKKYVGDASPPAAEYIAPPIAAMNADTQNTMNFSRASLAPRLLIAVGESRIAASASPILPRRMLVTASANSPKTSSPNR